MSVHPVFTRLLNNTKQHLPGAIDDALRVELFNVLDDFFKHSDVWKEEIEFEIEGGQREYTITPDSSLAALVTRLESVLSSADLPIAATMVEPGEIVLNVEPSADDTATATVILTVNDPVDRDGYPFVPDWILYKYHQAFLEGVVGRMMAQPSKPYSNAQMSVYHLRKFENAKANAKVDASHKNIHSAQNWRFPRFA